MILSHIFTTLILYFLMAVNEFGLLILVTDWCGTAKSNILLWLLDWLLSQPFRIPVHSLWKTDISVNVSSRVKFKTLQTDKDNMCLVLVNFREENDGGQLKCRLLVF